jgi:hypothetical protein
MLEHFIQGYLIKLKEAQERHVNKAMSIGGVADFPALRLEQGYFNGLEDAATIIMNLYKGNPEGIEKSNTER